MPCTFSKYVKYRCWKEGPGILQCRRIIRIANMGNSPAISEKPSLEGWSLVASMTRLMNASKNSCLVREAHLSPLSISHSFVTLPLQCPADIVEIIWSCSFIWRWKECFVSEILTRLIWVFVEFLAFIRVWFLVDLFYRPAFSPLFLCEECQTGDAFISIQL